MTNPLLKYYRIPKLYVKLPSNGDYYPDGFLDTSLNGELPVYPLTVKDQILLKTPDALFNGESLLNVIKNCVPGITDPKLLVEPDIKQLVLAIRVASSGATLEFTSACPKCHTSHNFDVNISHMTETFVDSVPDNTVNLDDQLIVHLRPYNFIQRHLQILNELEESKIIKMVEARQDLDENGKAVELGKHVDSMADRTLSLMALSVESVTIVSTSESVTDPKYIEDFIKGITPNQANVIMDKVRELNAQGPDLTSRFHCDNCGHEWDQMLDVDPTSFFG
jgi:hypothetical protein